MQTSTLPTPTPFPIPDATAPVDLTTLDTDVAYQLVAGYNTVNSTTYIFDVFFYVLVLVAILFIIVMVRTKISGMRE